MTITITITVDRIVRLDDASRERLAHVRAQLDEIQRVLDASGRPTTFLDRGPHR